MSNPDLLELSMQTSNLYHFVASTGFTNIVKKPELRNDVLHNASLLFQRISQLSTISGGLRRRIDGFFEAYKAYLAQKNDGTIVVWNMVNTLQKIESELPK